MDPAWVAAWAAVATAFIYIVLGVIALRQVGEAKRLRQEQGRPYVIVDFEFQRWVVYIVVRNIGRTPALNVRIAFDKRLQSTVEDAEVHTASIFQSPIPMLAPSRSIAVFFDVAHERLGRTDMPLDYEVDVSYYDSRNRKYEDPPYTLDLSVYSEASLEQRGLPELVDEVESIRKEMHKWTDGSRGLLTMTVDRKKHVWRQDRRYRQRQARTARSKGPWAYARHHWLWLRRRYGW